MLIRKAHGDDAPRVFVIRNQAINHQCSGHYPAADLQVWTTGSLGDYFIEVLEKTGHVAVIDGQIAASGMLDPESGQVDAVFVDPAYMGRGIGRQMMDYLEQLALQAGLPHLILDSTLNAADFYRHCGFVGEQVAQYHSPRGLTLACVPMIKHLAR
ncbi:GNAT family N-acetyltransferase [Pseudomonas chlororaphis]|uniref:GNAT family N-acetyltransferase n=1 Tax=Pseudomonas chlororaphis TaxID=587753 RepID=UPI000E0BCB23|nr:GNAT family N-acetyltransferase [Pseudomonas chlororaphis]AZD13926.1 acetyltransferase, GNAT family [Pseudomonas chlororaphis]WDH48423.1 GNAT family N-acetyltransferase [Pseudomonas chlororaphis]WDH60272.1 GNAT family N-acetyltransferase [Pseudomonas chlororaphis]WQE19527.1 GNAT family N-acetyltransferase [Pseudomonas chlororaphis]